MSNSQNLAIIFCSTLYVPQTYIRCGQSVCTHYFFDSEDEQMELPIEYDPDFGGGEEEDLSPEWQEAAKINVNDDPTLRVSRLKGFREALADQKIHLRLTND